MSRVVPGVLPVVSIVYSLGCIAPSLKITIRGQLGEVHNLLTTRLRLTSLSYNPSKSITQSLESEFLSIGRVHDPFMNAEQIIEHLKTLAAVERRAVLQFLQSDLKEDSESKQADDRKELKRLRGVFGKKTDAEKR